MSLRNALASNLMHLCEAEESIASVCRGTGINRQQFNRYLAGSAIPNDRNIEKICEYFGIDQSDLFQDRNINGAVPDTRARNGTDAAAANQPHIRAISEMVGSERHASVAPGLYYATFRYPGDVGTVVRSTVIVRNEANITTFRRLTGFAENKGSWWSQFHGDHRGIIFERRHWLYLMGMNQVGSHEPTMMTLRWVPNSLPILSGHASILTPLGPTYTAVAVTKCARGTSLRRALRNSRAYSVDDPSIEAVVIDILDQQCEELLTMARKLNLSVTSLSDGPKDLHHSLLESQ